MWQFCLIFGFPHKCDYHFEIPYVLYCNKFNFLAPVILVYCDFTLSSWCLGHLAWGPGLLIGYVIMGMSVQVL